MTWIVHPAAGIGVFEPSAAKIGVLFDDLKGYARLLQADCGQDARHARPDDQDLHLATGLNRGLIPNRTLLVYAIKSQFFHQERRITLRHLDACNQVHHPQDDAIGRTRREWFLAAQIGPQRCGGLTAQTLLNLRRIATNLAVAKEIIDRRHLIAQQAGIPGHMDQRHKQGRQMRLFEDSVEIGGNGAGGHGSCRPCFVPVPDLATISRSRGQVIYVQIRVYRQSPAVQHKMRNGA